MQKTYAFREINPPFAKSVIMAGFEHRQTAHAYAMAWFNEHGFEVIHKEADGDDAYDFMCARHRSLTQFAIDCVVTA